LLQKRKQHPVKLIRLLPHAQCPIPLIQANLLHFILSAILRMVSNFPITSCSRSIHSVGASILAKACQPLYLTIAVIAALNVLTEVLRATSFTLSTNGPVDDGFIIALINGAAANANSTPCVNGATLFFTKFY
jgi:hypothetical protein